MRRIGFIVLCVPLLVSVCGDVRADGGGSKRGRPLYSLGDRGYGRQPQLGRLRLPRSLARRGSLKLYDGSRLVVHRAKVGKRSRPMNLHYENTGTAYYGDPTYFHGGLAGLVKHLDAQRHPVIELSGVRQGEAIAVRANARSRVYVLAPDGQVIDASAKRRNEGGVETSPMALLGRRIGTLARGDNKGERGWELLKIDERLKPGSYQVVVTETGVKPPAGEQNHGYWARFRRYRFVVPKPDAPQHGVGMALARARLESKGLLPSEQPRYATSIRRWFVDHRGFGMNHELGTLLTFAKPGGQGRSILYRKPHSPLATFDKVTPVRLVGEGHSTREAAAHAGAIQTIKVGRYSYIDLPGEPLGSKHRLFPTNIGGYTLGYGVKAGDKVFVDLVVRDRDRSERYHRIKLVVTK